MIFPLMFMCFGTHTMMRFWTVVIQGLRYSLDRSQFTPSVFIPIMHGPHTIHSIQYMDMDLVIFMIHIFQNGCCSYSVHVFDFLNFVNFYTSLE